MKEQIPSEVSLLEQIRRGGQDRLQALRRLYEDDTLQVRISQHVRQNGGNLQDAEDIFHDGLVIFDRKVREGAIQDDANLAGYIYSVCRFLWRNRHRKTDRIDLTADQVDHGDHLAADRADFALLAQETRDMIDQVLRQLGDRCWQIMQLWKQDFSMDEIATQLGLSSSAMAKKNKYRCYQRLLKLLDKQPELCNQLKNLYEQ